MRNYPNPIDIGDLAVAASVLNRNGHRYTAKTCARYDVCAVRTRSGAKAFIVTKGRAPKPSQTQGETLATIEDMIRHHIIYEERFFPKTQNFK